MVKSLPVIQETQVPSLGQEDPLEKEMATHSSILAWEIPWTEEPDGLQSMGSQRVGHDWATNPLVEAWGSRGPRRWRICLKSHNMSSPTERDLHLHCASRLEKSWNEAFGFYIYRGIFFEGLSWEYPCHVKWNLDKFVFTNPIMRLSI